MLVYQRVIDRLTHILVSFVSSSHRLLQDSVGSAKTKGDAEPLRDRNSPIMKTSAKSNLAHGEANAGMAGVVDK